MIPLIRVAGISAMRETCALTTQMWDKQNYPTVSYPQQLSAFAVLPQRLLVEERLNMGWHIPPS